MEPLEIAFACPLPNGLHARPASLLAAEAARFDAAITFLHEPSGAAVDAKSTLALIGLDVRHGDACRLRIAGAEAEPARDALRGFVAGVLPGSDEPLSAPAITEAGLPRSLRATNVRWLAGSGASPGSARGVVVIAGPAVPLTELADQRAGTREEEEAKLTRAQETVRAALEARLQARVPPLEAAILGAHYAILEDVALQDAMRTRVRAGASAARAVADAVGSFAARLKGAASLYVRERAVDIEDIALQLLEAMEGGRLASAAPALVEPAIVVAATLAPRPLLTMERSLLRGLVLERGGATSHAVILARALGLPAVTGIADARAILRAGAEAIVDGERGLVFPEPDAAVRRHYERRERGRRRARERLLAAAPAPAITLDGARLDVAANLSAAAEAEAAFAQGADGIGLFRTEMLFLDRDRPPAEDEQLAAYAQAARAARGRPLVIRTFDVGGDKLVPYLDLPREANPFLGVRGMRVYLRTPDLLVTQMRAILRASALGPVWMMAPMVATPEEARWLRERLAAARAALTTEGLDFDPAMPFGLMIEVPSAALGIDRLAGEADFFSIGTNDLAQYVFAADRDNAEVAGLHEVRDPTFLRLLAQVAAGARRHGRWLGLCGEMARDPAHLPLLVGLGLDEISVSPPAIPALKAAVRRASAAACRALLERALACRAASEVSALLASSALAPARGLLDPDLVVLDSDSATREETIEEIADTLASAGRTGRPREVEEALWAREAVTSTNLGHGFAVPHCRSDALAASSIGVLRLGRPVAWDAASDEPVRCVIALAIRDADPGDTHLRILAKLARRLMHEEFRARLLGAARTEDVLRCLSEELEIPAAGT